jgi:hypothetical protein
MLPIPIHDILFIMAIILFALGLLSTIAGIIVLIFRAAGKDISTLAIQSTRLVQKGLAEDVAGLVGNASALLETVNQLVRTTAGIGVFLTVLGVIMMMVASWLALQIL